MTKITLLAFAAAATFSAGVAYAQSSQTDETSALQTAIETAQTVLSTRGVGYPTANSTAYNTLTTAIETAKEALSSSSTTDAATATTTLNAAVTAYKSTTTEIQMPEDGKTYTITAVASNGKKGYMNYTSGTGYGIVTTTATTNEGYPTSAKFVCKTNPNGGYIFINSEGKSFIFLGNKNTVGYNSNKGYVDPTDANFLYYAPLTVEKMVKSGNSNVTASNQAALFGYVILKGGRPNNGTNNTFIVKHSANPMAFDQAGAAVYYNDNHTSAMLIEEATAADGMSQGVGQVANAIVTKAEADAAKTGVGYPASESASRTALSTAINQAKTAIEAGTATTANIILSEWGAFLAETNVQMPEDGKAYTLTFLANNGNKYYIDYAESGYRTVRITSSETTLPQTATFICRKTTDGKYVFVNNYGKYLAWKGTGSGTGANANIGYNSNKGYADAYSSTQTIKQCLEFAISKVSDADSQTIGNVVTVTANSNDDLLGCVKAITATRSETNHSAGCLTLNVSSNSFDNSGGANFRDGFTAALLIEEAQYPNEVALNPATGINGIQTIGTFSAPFRTIVPSGVKAYYVSGTETEGTEYATTTAIEEGKSIPANTGVLLTSTDANTTTALMKPALDETDATITNNRLQHSAGANKEITESNAFILGMLNGQVAFYALSTDADAQTIGMNKSYLVLANAATSKLSLDFGTTTGINGTPTADPAADPNAPVFDITGRRITNLQKGGLYIKNGKKFIVK